MKLYIDGDALPNLLKPIIFRAIKRVNISTVVVSNKPITIGESTLINYMSVSEGPDEADDKIVELVEADDLVITADIPLADRVITKNAHAIGHRGKPFTEANIKNVLALRDIMQGIRDSGELTRGQAAFTKKDCREFANQLDKFLTKYNK